MGSRTSVVSQKNVMVINFTQSHVSISFSCTISEIQILAVPYVLAHWKSLEQGFMKKTRWS
ncbi:hypothetical protein BHE74_00051290 [Ensete ventricosum]|nr:hypothetical protein BHE74_00051290 [Ensete ventricosum]